MALPSIAPDRLRELAAHLRLALAPGEAEDLTALSEFIRSGLDRFEMAPPPAATSPAPARFDSKDPFNAVITRCDVAGAGHGPLAGRRIGLKDNIAVAGVPMTCGTAVLSNFVPDRHAVVVERLLAAGARIAAKLNMDALAWSGGADTSSFGPIRNPVAPERAAAGSSGGSAAALHLPDIDLTLGTDQGGSVRVPASWCGVLGLKPTYGLVPYTGVAGMDATVDHVGPLAHSVEDLALLLSVIAGPDGEDPRQCGVPAALDFVDAVDQAPADLSGTVIGVLEDGFAGEREPDPPPGTKETMAAVRDAANRLAGLGAELRRVSIPEHAAAPAVLFVLLMESLASSFDAPHAGYGDTGRQDPAFDLALGRALRSPSLPPTVRAAALYGVHLRAEYSGAAYARARQRAKRLTAAVDDALAGVDLLLLPTATHYAHPLADDPPAYELVTRGWDMFANTITFNLTGHPALSMPLAQADELPVGVMLVARRLEEPRLLAVARTIEQALGWFPEVSPRRPGAAHC